MNTLSNNPSDHTIFEMLCRGFWMLIGPMLLIPIAVSLVDYGNGWFTKFDFLFLGVLVAMLLARGFEFYKGHPRTSEGTPATPAHFRRYALGVVLLGALAWIVANVLGNYVLNGGVL
jgi:hypothetical protein